MARRETFPKNRDPHPETAGLLGKRFELAVAALSLAISAYLFAQAFWGHWFYMVLLSSGAVAIVGYWLFLRGIASPLALIPAAVLLVYYTDLPSKLLPLLTVEKTSATYDAFLFYVDRSFGFSPSILVCRWVSCVPHLNQFFFTVYMALSLVMGCSFAAHLRQTRPPWRIVLLLGVAVNIGVICYNLLPACGPLMLLGTGNFLHGDPLAAFPGTAPAIVSLPLRFPRNAMPSLHMTWALILLWINRDLRLGRWFAAIFALLTAVATLSTGEHYLVDLVVAFPFALVCWNLCAGHVPLSHPRRTLTIFCGIFVYISWIAAIRFIPSVFYASPVIPWLASIVTVAGTLSVVYLEPMIQFVNRPELPLTDKPQHRTSDTAL